MKFTKKIMTMATCAIMLGGIATGNSDISFKNYEGFSTNAVIIDDSPLVKVSSTSNSNFDQRVVQLYAVYSDGTYSYSTGFIVGDNEIASCAHGLYKGGYPEYVNVYVKRCGSSTYDTNYSFKLTYSSEKQNIVVHDNYKTTGDDEYDIGIITTTTDLSALGKFTLNTAYTPNKTTPHTYTVKGYPMEATHTEYQKYQCYSSGDYKSSSNEILRYFASTLGGMSGAPVIYDGKVVAINVGHIDTTATKYNLGTRNISWLNNHIS
ncbi:MAG: trypsin-like peptidase domain-containing protein [Oscillospiraceae bacterium]|nr:trypsin-like peptidase domain-containing protein [Oscillospiraceae bacterium]MBQ7794506.1 trypsin-like peptidase domain-containing protein [Clostridia bacterium]